MSTDRASESADGGESSAANVHRLRYQEQFEFARDGQLVTDTQGVITAANLAAATALRCPKEFLIGKPLGLFVVGGNRTRFYECLARLHGGAGSDEFEIQVSTRDTERVLAVRVSSFEGGPGAATAFRWSVRDITEQRRAEAAREDLLRRLVSAQEFERRRVALELHDSVGQLLSALMLGVRAVRDSSPLPPAALARLDEVQRLADKLGQAVHDLAVDLRPSTLDDLGLIAALQHYLEDWSSRTGIEVQFEAVGLETARFAPEVETTLYRLVQEALTNVLKHAGARLVSVVVERQDGLAIAVVEDNGVGFDLEAAVASGQLGLLGMRERVTLMGGSLEVESSPGAGTTLVARIPLHAPDTGERR